MSFDPEKVERTEEKPCNHSWLWKHDGFDPCEKCGAEYSIVPVSSPHSTEQTFEEWLEESFPSVYFEDHRASSLMRAAWNAAKGMA